MKEMQPMKGFVRWFGGAAVIILLLLGFITLVFLLLGYDLAPASRICPR